ncbi:hypothetical protein [Pseudoalteromonas sp. MMG005]|uniref:hypothetical protein n=1 Tax=Pseudoalteromonas sp. MMG005 TaxID=2822682 RepID=UPI001B3A658D|nr:hypothetical protein [Pseudoalteromonas sp. MMG005]MBQ4847442.1 hypothetical protein [Pseudoalteromonas sp. MMG005]
MLNAQDKESDPLSISIENQPDWLSYTLENNQVKLSVSPDFLDIETHTYPISVSDGKASTSYELTVNVIDNPQAWAPIDISAAELTGAWEDKQQHLGLIFDQKEQGLLINNGALSRFEYNSDYLDKLNMYQYGCKYDCDLEQYNGLKILAKSPDKLYVVLSTDNNDKQTYMLRKTSPVSGEKVYARTPESEIHADIINLNSNDKRLATLSARSLMPKHYSSADPANIHYDINSVIGTYNNRSGKFTPEEQTINQSFTYYRYPDVRLEFAIQYDTLKILGKIQDHLIIESSYTYQLITQGVDIDASPEWKSTLSELLIPQSDLIAYPIDVLSGFTTPLQAGKTYAGKIAPDQLKWTLGDYNYKGGIEFTLTDDSTGTVTLSTADKSLDEIRTFHYSQSGSELSLTFGETLHKYKLYTSPSGKAFMSMQLTAQDSNKAYDNKGFVHYELDTTFTSSDYIGSYTHLTYPLSPPYNMYLGTDKAVYYLYPDIFVPLESDIFKIEEDGSYTFIRQRFCQEIESRDFDECHAFATEKYGVPRVRNIKLLKIEGDIYTFKYGYMAMYYGQLHAFETTRRFEKRD